MLTARAEAGDHRLAAGQKIATAEVATVLRVAAGEHTKSEALGLGDNEFVPWQIGAVM